MIYLDIVYIGIGLVVALATASIIWVLRQE